MQKKQEKLLSNTKKHYKIVGFGVCGKGEADKYLESTLKEFKRLCDETYIVCNNAGKKEIDLIKKYKFNIIIDNREWGKEQWRIKENAIKNIDADWFIVLDMDEVFDSRFDRDELEKLIDKGGAGYYFYIVNLYDGGYAKDWSFWNIRLFNGRYNRNWERKSLHCGLAPKIAYKWGNYAPFMVKHYGLKDKKSREKKVKRYNKYDPDAKFKGRQYYDFLNSKVVADCFDEDYLRDLIKKEVENYYFKIPKNMEKEVKKFYYVKNPAGVVVDIEEAQLEETLARDGFELMSKEPVVIGDEFNNSVEERVIEKNTEDVVEEEKDTGNDLQCDTCGFIAKSKGGLVAHTRKHKE